MRSPHFIDNVDIIVWLKVFSSKLIKVFHFTEEGGKFVMSLKAFVSLSAICQVHVYKFLSKPVHITYITLCLRKNHIHTSPPCVFAYFRIPFVSVDCNK